MSSLAVRSAITNGKEPDAPAHIGLVHLVEHAEPGKLLGPLMVVVGLGMLGLIHLRGAGVTAGPIFVLAGLHDTVVYWWL